MAALDVVGCVAAGKFKNNPSNGSFEVGTVGAGRAAVGGPGRDGTEGGTGLVTGAGKVTAGTGLGATGGGGDFSAALLEALLEALVDGATVENTSRSRPRTSRTRDAPAAGTFAASGATVFRLGGGGGASELCSVGAAAAAAGAAAAGAGAGAGAET